MFNEIGSQYVEVCMFEVSKDQYPINKDWNEKIFTTPSIPGGKDYLLANLKNLFLLVKDKTDLNTVPQLTNSEGKQTLEYLCVHALSPMNFVVRTNTGFELTDAANLWLDSEDDDYLAAYFCANVRFFGEILYYLDSPKKAGDLFDIAVNEYDMAWKNTTTINNRLIWLRQFGLIDFQEFSLLYSITEKGKDFLKKICPVMPEQISKDEDKTLGETEIVLSPEVYEYYQNNKNQVRRPSIGYFPGKMDECIDSTRTILEFISDEPDYDKIYQFAQTEFGISTSSVKTFLGNMLAMGLIERTSNTEFRITDIGASWLKKQDALDLVVLLQIKSLFLLEILIELVDNTTSVKELTVKAKVSYGFEKENLTEIRNRISLLKLAGLVMNASSEKYRLTNRGQLLINRFFDEMGISRKGDTTVSKEPNLNEDIVSELRIASKDSYNPDRFERAVRDYFARLGFEAEWIGGAGNTDVLIKTTGSPQNSYVVTVDAKSTSSPNVTDGLVDFDTLKEHKKKHHSDYIAIVGRSFDSERLVQRAIEHNVVLLDVDTLAALLEIQTNTPLKLSDLSKVFEQSGKADLEVLREEQKKIETTGILTKKIMECLINEAHDEVTKGQLSVRDIYRSLRGMENIQDKVTVEAIEQVLDFLASPIIGCVTKEKDYYVAKGSLQDTARIFDYLRKLCAR